MTSTDMLSLFQKSMQTNLSPAESKEISQMMVMEAVKRPEKNTILNNMDKYDWSRVTYADPRDPRCTEGDCKGSHQVEKFARGSLSGVNRHGLWLTCSQCRLRILYCPTVGAKATFRSAGPLPKDVSEKLKEKAEGKEVHPDELRTQALGLAAAESSALSRLEEIRKEKDKIAAKTAAKAGYRPGPKAAPKFAAEDKENPLSKKTVKRDHPLSPEVQEKEWVQVVEDTES